MEKICLILLILNLSLVLGYQSDPSYYSQLLPFVRKDVINKILVSLPDRKKANILQMSNTMNKYKDEYSLNEAESAFLVYSWIGKTIEIDCDIDNQENQFPVNVYNWGKGNYIGFTGLFYTFVSNLNIKVIPIQGKKKVLADEVTEDVITVLPHVWSSIFINNTYFLVDAAGGAGYCYKKFLRKNTDFYFGTKPEYLIRTHLPDNNEWQLLDEKITPETFDSWPFIHFRFYLEGFKTISPFTNILDISKHSKVILTYDKENSNLRLSLNLVDYNGNYVDYQSSIIISNGKAEIELTSSLKNKHSLIIYAKQGDSPDSFLSVLVYKVK